jgi:hypothetical protein
MLERILLVCTVAALFTCTLVSAQSPSKPSKHSGSPIVGEFQVPQESGEDYEHRQIRERRYSASHAPGEIFDPGTLVNGKSESTDLTVIDVAIGRSPDPPGIPASVSTAIILATVVSGKCFVTGDHSYVYTDYQLKIDEILKPDTSANLAAGVLAIGSRPGGAVHFPSGHVTKVFDAGQGLPAVGSQYILFLWKAIPDLPEYEIMSASGYEVKARHVYPLDDTASQYDNMSFPVFLSVVQKAIVASQNEGVEP